MFKAVNKAKFIHRYMESLALYTGAPTVCQEDIKSCIYVVEDEIVTPRVKHIDIPVFFIHEQFDNVIYIPKYDKSSVMPEDMCTKLYAGPIIIQSTK